MANNSQLIPWEPPAGFLDWVVPVQDEDASAGLTACSLPDGRAICMWPLGADVRFAIIADMDVLLTTDSVPSSDYETALTAGFAVHRTCVFTTDGDIYFSILGSTADPGDMFWVRIYKADDPLDPSAGWTLHGTVKNGVNYNTGPDFGGAMVVGFPLILSSGRWIMTSSEAYRSTAFGGFRGRDGALWTSDDVGVTWTRRLHWQHGSPAHLAQRITTHSCQSPDEATTYSMTQPSNFVADTVTSTDDGTNWSTPGYTGEDEALIPFMDNGTDVYAFDPGFGVNDNGVIKVLSGTAWVDVVETWNSAVQGDIRDAGDDGDTVHAIVDQHGGLWHFVGKYVATSGGGCVPIHPEQLFIPYKDRLIRLVDDFTEPAIERAIDQSFDNFKTLERWAHGWMSLANSPDRCQLFIPYRDHSRQSPETSAAQSFDNWKVIERWAYRVASGECGCSCPGTTPPPDRCRLFVPHKDHLLDIDMTDLDALQLAAEAEFDNFKALERWANLYAAGDCGCTT